MSIIQYLEDGNHDVKPTAFNIYTDLLEEILTKKLKPGSKLTENKICDKYKVSRTPVREALKLLYSGGLVEDIPNRGCFVLEVSDSDINDMVEMRSIYELQCVRYGISRVTKAELDEMTELIEFMEFYTMKNDIPKMMNINSAFHQLIYNSTHNRFLKRIILTLQLYIKYARPEDYYKPGYLEEVFKEHKAIYDAYIDADVEAGVYAMKVHMNNSKKRLGL